MDRLALEHDLALVGGHRPRDRLDQLDLPAPLSPITARISPGIRSKSEWSSAVTLAVALHQFAGLKNWFGHDITLRLSDPLVDRDRGDDEHADQEIGPLRVGAQHAQAELEDADDQRAEEHAEDRAAPAEQRDAADHHRGDRLDVGELPAEAEGDTEPKRPIITQPAIAQMSPPRCIDRDQHLVDLERPRVLPPRRRRRSRRRAGPRRCASGCSASTSTMSDHERARRAQTVVRRP